MLGFKMMIVIVIACLLLSNHLIEARPNGAPPESCATMVPNHGVPVQQSVSPYMTMIAQDNNLLVSGNRLPLTLQQRTSSNNNSTFRGFLVIAFDANNPTVSLGTFYSVNNDSKPLQCANSSNAITHVINNDKTSVVVQWMPPDGFVGEVMFRTTYVMNVSTFWVRTIGSLIVTVVAAPTTSTSTTTTTTMAPIITSPMAMSSPPNNGSSGSSMMMPTNKPANTTMTTTSSSSCNNKSLMTIVLFFLTSWMML